MTDRTSYFKRINSGRRELRLESPMKGIFSHLPGNHTPNEFWLSPTFYRIPTLHELRDALRQARDSREGLIRMIGTIDILSLEYSRRLLEGGGRTIGLKNFLKADGYLLSRYSTLRRYKNLAEMIRVAGNLDPMTMNLLFAIEPCPPEMSEFEKDIYYDPVREFVDGIDGATFREFDTYIRTYLKNRKWT